MPVYKLVEMPYEEYLGWIDYFDRHPVGWREDSRTFKLLQAQGVKAKPAEVFPTLKAIYSRMENERVVRKNSVMHQLIMSSVGGVRIPE